MSLGDVSAILLPVQGGKSQLVAAMGKSTSSNGTIVRLIDVDAYAEKNLTQVASDAKTLTGNDFDLKVFPAIKAKVAQDVSNFKGDKFVLVCSNPSLLSHLTIGAKKTWSYIPDTKLFAPAVIAMAAKDAVLAAKMLESRDNFVLRAPKGLEPELFSSWDDLASKVSKDILGVK